MYLSDNCITDQKQNRGSLEGTHGQCYSSKDELLVNPHAWVLAPLAIRDIS